MGPAFSWLMETLLLVWLAALAAMILYKMLTGEIRLTGLLAADGTPLSAERVQLLIGTLAALGGYALTVLEASRAAPDTLSRLPDVPTSLLVLFGGSNTFYLASKFFRSQR